MLQRKIVTLFQILICFVILIYRGNGELAEATEKIENAPSRKKFIIDTDAGADDAVAILYSLGAEKLKDNVRIIGITCTYGNTEVDNVVANVLKTLKTVDRLDIPVYKGCDHPILNKVESDGFFGKDGFGDFEFEDPPPPSMVNSKHAVNALISSVRKRPGQISLLCLAPLTNIAMAIRMYPNFLKEVKDVYILGATVEGHGGTQPGIEFNFFTDPEAAAIVLNNAQELGKKVTLLPSDTFFNRCNLTLNWRLNTLGALNTSSVQLINKAEAKTLTDENWVQADQLLAAVAINDSLITRSSLNPVAVETCGSQARGSVFVNYRYPTDNSTVRIVQEIDMKTYKKLLLKYFGV